MNLFIVYQIILSDIYIIIAIQFDSDIYYYITLIKIEPLNSKYDIYIN